jgi:Zn-dependent protease with chaperone function
MKFEPQYIEENVNVSRKNYGQEFFKLASIFLIIMVIAYLALGFCAEQIAIRMPISMEKNLGKALVRAIDEDNFQLTKEYSQKILNRLISVSKGIPQFDYRVDIIDDETVNAVALPGGRIVLFRGLIEKIECEEALAMVLGHELGHYVHRDHLRGLGRSLVMMTVGMLLGADGKQLNIIIPSVEVIDLKYSRTDEKIADDFALDTVFKAYGHVGGTVDFYNILEDKKYSKWSFPLFSTHPDIRQRKNDLSARIASHKYSVKNITPLPDDGHLPFSGERYKENKK